METVGVGMHLEILGTALCHLIGGEREEGGVPFIKPHPTAPIKTGLPASGTTAGKDLTVYLQTPKGLPTIHGSGLVGMPQSSGRVNPGRQCPINTRAQAVPAHSSLIPDYLGTRHNLQSESLR